MEPTWHREAKELGLRYIVITYGKAEGLAFCPQNLEKPFRVGGDYDGNWPVTPEGALEHMERWFNRYFIDNVEWFLPYIEKVANGVDFSLDDLKLDDRRVMLVHGPWPWGGD